MTTGFCSCWRCFYRLSIVLCLLLTSKSQSLSHKVQENEDADERGLSFSNASALPLQDSRGNCVDGWLLPAWTPIENITVSQRVGRGFAYFAVLVFLFIGIAIGCGHFMAAIDEITCTERRIVTKHWNGKEQVRVVRLWNDTVANLTLMAFGSSAPEILLSLIELFQNNFQAGDLGPGTILGSAAYNLLVIIAVCISAVPSPQVRKIQHLAVFLTTAAWSIFAYIWLYAILAWISPGRVEVWEGLLTLMFAPVIVAHAYIAERKFLCYKRFKKKKQITFKHDSDADEWDEIVLESGRPSAFEERQEYITLLKHLREKYPQRDLEQLQAIAQVQFLREGRKTRAFYRAQSSLKIIGSSHMRTKSLLLTQNEATELRNELAKVDVVDKVEAPVRVLFDPSHYTVMEDCGDFRMRVLRHGDISVNTKLEYHTKDGTAKAGIDYTAKKGILSFPPGVEELFIRIEVISNEVFEEDKHFYVHLQSPSDPAMLCSPHVATVLVLDDDHMGEFSFKEQYHEMTESIGVYKLIVKRYAGSRGKVFVAYRTEDGTALADKDYVPKRGELVFENNEIEKYIVINIIDESSIEKDVTFYVNLDDPTMPPDDKLTQMFKLATSKPPDQRTKKEKTLLLGEPKIGDVPQAVLRIKRNEAFQNTIDNLQRKSNAALVVGTSLWKQQLMEELTLPSFVAEEDDYDDEENEILIPSRFDYFMHFVTLFWRILFALIPPAGLYNGYVCFVVSLFLIGLFAALINDAASHFGCTVGMSDALTAMTVITIGTSMPDTFASKIAAIQDKTADNSIGNVTGSNAVNVFVGIGLAWTLGAIYQERYGRVFEVQPGSLAFSITLYTICAIICIPVILWRRRPPIGGELGGPLKYKILHSGLFITVYILFLLLNALADYGVLKGL